MDSKAKKLLDQIALLLDKAKEEEDMKYMLVACHKDNEIVIYNGNPKDLGETLANHACNNRTPARTLTYAHLRYIEKMENELAKLKEKEAEKCQEKSKL
jgi:hypothetical protein